MARNPISIAYGEGPRQSELTQVDRVRCTQESESLRQIVVLATIINGQDTPILPVPGDVFCQCAQQTTTAIENLRERCIWMVRSPDTHVSCSMLHAFGDAAIDF